MAAAQPPTAPVAGVIAPLVAAGGRVVLGNLVAPELLRQLAAECDGARPHAQEQHQAKEIAGGHRSGRPARRLLSAEGGPVQTAFYHDPRLADALSRLCGRGVRPTGAVGSYSYYERRGDFLGLHRDIPGCDAALITCLRRDSGGDSGGALRLYPHAFRDPLASIVRRRAPHVDLNLRVGQSVLLLGGWIPHEVLPAAAGHLRHISLLCFSLAASREDRGQPLPR